MNPLALLCNLHAEGPTTLRRLRSAGLKDLDDLATFPEEELAAALDCDLVYARRFVCEGRLLGERFGFDVSEAPEPRQVAPPRQPRAPSPAPPPQRPRAEAPTPGALRAGDVEGLDADWCAALVAQGVLTLEALADAPGLPLARALGRSLPRLLELQCLARRRLLDGAPEPAVAAEPATAATPREAEEPKPATRAVVLYPRAAPYRVAPVDPPASMDRGGPRSAYQERPVAPSELPGSGGPFS